MGRMEQRRRWPLVTISPRLLAFSGLTAATWNAVIVGILVSGRAVIHAIVIAAAAARSTCDS
jgi:hypothetical protein